MITVKKSYRTLNEEKLVDFATKFKKNLEKSSASFPEPPVKAAEMDVLINDYSKAAETWRAERSSYNSGQTIVAKDKLIEGIDSNVAYVEPLAASVEAVEALGLEASSAGERKKGPIPGAPEDAGVKESGEPLSATMFCKPVKLENSAAKVSYYVYETNADGTEERRLMMAGTSCRDLSFGGLETGKVYYFYVRAKTSGGFGPPSAPVRWVGR